jgi:hypothetical protein
MDWLAEVLVLLCADELLLRGVVVCASAGITTQDMPVQIAKAATIFMEFLFITVFNN